jgi:NAD(P)-dependent dehydrogenase (short-subunit alcohol dehydrogenase family)
MNQNSRDAVSRSNAISFLAKAALVAGAGFTALKLARRAASARFHMRGKTVLITGSRGLGLAIAQELGRRGARIALCARNEAELQQACASLARERIEALPFPADVSAPSEIAPLVSRVVSKLGGIDVLVNNAGEIRVGPYQTFTPADYEHAMNLMFWAAVNLTFQALPHIKARRGQIVNITSVGGRVSIPHLLPYSCAKFALVGFSTGLSAETRSEGVHVLTVVPGLMRTGSHLHAFFKGNAHNEFAWFTLLGNLPGFSVPARYAAHSIAEAMGKNRHVCTISLSAKMLIACEALLPETTRRVLSVANATLLPQPNTSHQASEGKFLNGRFGKLFRAATVLGRRAAHDFNQ